MSKRTALLWAIEFICLTAIAIVLSTATALAKVWVAVPAIVIAIVKFAEYRQNTRVPVRMIRFQLQVLVAILPADVARIRCTYHWPRRKWFRGITELRQAFDYIPEGGGAGRPFPVQKGIIGKVYSVKAARVENFASDQEYRERMVAEYNYTTAELAQRSADRRSYACYPVMDENHNVLGLIYLDSDQPNTFTMDQTNPRWQAICRAGEVVGANILAPS